MEQAVSTNVWNSDGWAIESCIELFTVDMFTECGCLKHFNYKIVSNINK